MALITCTECGKRISSSASACPHCGKSRANVWSWFNRTAGNVLTILIILGFLLFLFSTIGGYLLLHK